MRGRLRRPYRPLQVIGVLAAVLPIARKSLQFSRSAERAGRLPIPAQINRAKPGERLHANTTGGQLSMRANALLSCQRTAIVRIRHVAISERQQLEEVDGFLVRSEMKAWEAIMSSPIHLDDNTDPALIYAPPWARERIIPISEPTSRYRASTTTAIKMGPKKFKPKYSGDRAMLALQRQLALHPNRIPEPSSGSAIAIGPVLMRLCSVTVGRGSCLGACILCRSEENRRNQRFRPCDREQSRQCRRGTAIAIATNPIARSARPNRQVTTGCREDCRCGSSHLSACACRAESRRDGGGCARTVPTRQRPSAIAD